MKTLLAFALAGAALYALDARASFGGGSSQGGGAGSSWGDAGPDTFGDGELQDGEREMCAQLDAERAALREQIAKEHGITGALFYCDTYGRDDATCVRIAELTEQIRKCSNDVWVHNVKHPQAIVGPLLSSLLGGVLTDVTWLLVGGGILFLAVSR